jgi:hypothetical protein
MPDNQDEPPRDGEATQEHAEISSYLVTHAEAASAVVRDVVTGQVHTLAEHPSLHAGEVLQATVRPEPPLGVTSRIASLEERRDVPVAVSDEPPTAHERSMAGELGEVNRFERAGTGEIHVMRVPADTLEETVEDLQSDEEVIARAARLGVDRVEIRCESQLLAIRYLP